MICKDFMVFIDYGFFVSYCYCMFKFGRLLKELNIMKFGDLIKKKLLIIWKFFNLKFINIILGKLGVI